jgi:hypothetical protein
MPPKQVLDGGLAWNFHVPRRPLGAVPTAGIARQVRDGQRNNLRA